MQHTTTTGQKDILNTQLNVENNPRSDSGNEQIFKTKRINKTPFSIVNKDEQYFLTVGNYVISPTHNTEEKTIQWLEENKWDAVTTLILLLIDKMQENKEPEIRELKKATETLLTE